MSANLPAADFEVLVRRAGLTFSAEQIAALREQWQHVAPMLERIRGAERGREVEPAMIFRPVSE